ncbi:MAG: sigma-70 family RNA polymerase sigma factor [Chloroflexota bacterium]
MDHDDRDVRGGPISQRSGTHRSSGLIAESEIVAAVLEGDRDAFRILVDREAPAVVRACHRILGDFGEAEDVAQEAFVTAYRSLGTWRADGPFGAWLSRIAVRLAIRQAGRRKTLSWIAPTLLADGSTDDPVARLRSSASTEPEQLVLRGERRTAVRSAVIALDEPYREVVALRFFGERSLDEIATLTGRPIGTVKTHLHRGLLRLRLALGGADG